MSDGPVEKDVTLETWRVQEVVGVTRSLEDLCALVDQLARIGFDRSDIDLKARRDAALQE